MPLPTGAEAPAFSLPARDGSERSLEDFTRAGNGAVVLAFFKASCPVCKLAFPVYGELQRRYGDAIPVVGVAQDPVTILDRWLEEQGFEGPVLDDDENDFEVSMAFDIQTVPTLVLVEGGRVASVSEGWDRDRINEWAEDLGRRTGRDTSPVSTDGDGRPVFRPG